MTTETLKEEDIGNCECSEKISEEKISIEDTDDDDDYKLTLKNLWGTDIANYFLNPNFQKTTKIKTITNQSITNQSIPNQSINDNLFIGGYPNGMLHGARIPFHYKLKSWLFDLKQINMNQSIDNRKSIKSIKSIKSMKCPIISHSPIRTNSVFNLIDLLKYHIGTNYSAQYLWNLLRYKSYEQLINYEKQLTNEEQITYSAFTHEYVLKGKEKPPLCDFIRENPSNSLMNIMKQLKSPSIEKQLRKMNLSVSWANRNQDQFRMISFQQNLKDAIKSIETNQFTSTLLNHHQLKLKHELDSNLKLNDQQVDQLMSFYPTLKNKQNETFIDNDIQPLENYFPDYSKIQDSIKKVSKLPNSESMTKKSTKSFDHLSFWHANQSIKSPKKTEIKYQSINNKQEKTSYQLKPLRKPSNISISTSPVNKKLQPLCWSDLLETNKQKRDYSKHISELYSSLSNENSRNNSMDCSFIKKTLWKPAKAIVS
ncbi:unnamed protein product [Schistosoma bovis]|nr:unnamed protein product [Schistosoma bovis]